MGTEQTGMTGTGLSGVEAGRVAEGVFFAQRPGRCVLEREGTERSEGILGPSLRGKRSNLNDKQEWQKIQGNKGGDLLDFIVGKREVRRRGPVRSRRGKGRGHMGRVRGDGMPGKEGHTVSEEGGS